MRGLPSAFGVGRYGCKRIHWASERSVGYVLLIRDSVQNGANPHPYQTGSKDEPDPKAISCYGLYVPECEKVWLRFVDGRPVSGITIHFLSWCCEKLEAAGKRVWVLIWDNASWHTSKGVREWIASHNRRVKKSGRGVRIVSCLLPKQSPWLNAIEPKWIHGKRKVVEPDGLLTAYELADRVCGVFDCAH